jgi:hypothetical protein
MPLKKHKQSIAKMEVDMMNLTNNMNGFTEEAKKAIDVYGNMSQLKANVTAQSDWIDGTAKETAKLKDELTQFHTETLPMAKAVESQCKTVLSDINRKAEAVENRQRDWSLHLRLKQQDSF